MNFGYYFALAIVTRFDEDTGEIALKMHPDDPILTDVIVKDTRGYKIKYISIYAPNIRFGTTDDSEPHFFRAKDEDIFNVPTGFMNLPKVNDVIFIGVYVYQDKGWRQLMTKSILVLGQLQKRMPVLNQDDNILGDRSGAKLHFNHNWFDSSLIERPTGHTTLVSNRLAILSGKRFLNFGLLSFLFQKGLQQGSIVHNPTINIPNLFEQAKKGTDAPISGSVKWGDIFTRGVTSESVLEPKFSGQLQKLKSGQKFLEPPPPPEDGKMDLHESGWKREVYKEGNTQKIERASIKVIGDTYLKYAFSRDGKESDGSDIAGLDSDESTRINDAPSLVAGVDLEYHDNGTDVIATEKNADANGVEEQVRSGFIMKIPATKPTTISEAQNEIDTGEQGEVDKHKILVGNIKVIIDSTGMHIS